MTVVILIALVYKKPTLDSWGVIELVKEHLVA